MDAKAVYRIVHKTIYTYSEPVTLCHNVSYLTPRALPHQDVLNHSVEVSPKPAVLERREDFYGNTVSYFTVQKPHKKLEVTSDSTVHLSQNNQNWPSDTPKWEQAVQETQHGTAAELLVNRHLSFPSPLVPVHPQLEEYARRSFVSGRPVAECAIDLMRRIHGDFTFDPHHTTVATPLLKVFQSRRGVCQDFAHVLIACFRSLKLSARYVSGYIETHPPKGRVRLVGADASHAWVSVYIPHLGWYELDPTNNQVPSGQHITTAFGRDYGDIPPMKGVIHGGGTHKLDVAVDVLRQSNSRAEPDVKD